MKCIVGLGNIGKRFEHTRHNIGFEVVDYLLDKYNFNLDKQNSKVHIPLSVLVMIKSCLSNQ